MNNTKLDIYPRDAIILGLVYLIFVTLIYADWSVSFSSSSTPPDSEQLACLPTSTPRVAGTGCFCRFLRFYG